MAFEFGPEKKGGGYRQRKKADTRQGCHTRKKGGTERTPHGVIPYADEREGQTQNSGNREEKNARTHARIGVSGEGEGRGGRGKRVALVVLSSDG